MVVTTYDGDLEGAEQLSANMGIGYQATDQITAGVQKSGDDYAVFVRYAVKDDIYATFNMPTKDGSDDMQVGLGYSMNIWNNVYFEPSYTMPIKEDADTGDREGSFNFGLAYRF
jgi:hypothetical protein